MSKKGVTVRRVVSVIVSLAVLTYVGFQIYSAYHSSIKTEYALNYTFYDSISADGILIRNEHILQSDATGVVSYSQPSGSKIAAGRVVAKVFSNEEEATKQSRIDEIDEQIEELSALQTEGTQLSANAQAMEAKISESINRLLDITDTGTTKGYEVVAQELIRNLNKKQIALGTAAGFQTYLAELNAEKKSLETGVHSYSEVTSEVAGYFVSTLDGYEDDSVYEDAAKLTVSDIEALTTAEPKPAGGVGKVIVSSEWYVAATVTNTVAQNLGVDSVVTLTMPLLSSDVYTCKVVGVNVDYATGKTALVLQGNQMNAALAQARMQNIQIRLHSYSGLRVNHQALRVVDGITGVYVVNGIAAAFKPVELLYSDAGFSVCRQDASGSNALKMYDEVIVEGSDLYDGKIIR